MPMNVFIVLNPVAGSAEPKAFQNTLASVVDERAWSYSVYETTGQERLREVVEGALSQGYELVVAAGGDGTVSGAASGLAGTGVPLGIVPLGTGNALAIEMGIPLETEAACRLLVEGGQRRAIDVMRVGEEVYLLDVAVGLSAWTMAETPRESKRSFGRLAYIWTGLRRLLRLSLWRFHLEIDGRPVRTRAFELAVVNAPTMGHEAFKWGSRVRIDDGRLDVCMVGLRGPQSVLRLIAGLLTGQQERTPEFECRPAERQVVVRSRRPLPVQADGEILGHTPVTVSLDPRALEVIVPAEVA